MTKQEPDDIEINVAQFNVANAIRAAAGALNEYAQDALALGLRVDLDIEPADSLVGEVYRVTVEIYKRV